MVTPAVEASGGKGPGSGSASKQALRKVNAEQSLETGNADAELVREKRRPLSPWEGEPIRALGRAAGGYWARGMRAKDDASTREAQLAGELGLAPSGPTAALRGAEAGPGGSRIGPILPVSSEKVRGREGALVQGKRRKERERRVAVRLQPPLRVREAPDDVAGGKRRQVRPHLPREMYVELTVGIILRQPCPEAECGKSACSV